MDVPESAISGLLMDVPESALKKMDLDEMIGKYSLSNKEYEQLMELQKPEYQEMWAKLLAVE